MCSFVRPTDMLSHLQTWNCVKQHGAIKVIDIVICPWEQYIRRQVALFGVQRSEYDCCSHLLHEKKTQNNIISSSQDNKKFVQIKIFKGSLSKYAVFCVSVELKGKK